MGMKDAEEIPNCFKSTASISGRINQDLVPFSTHDPTPHTEKQRCNGKYEIQEVKNCIKKAQYHPNQGHCYGMNGVSSESIALGDGHFGEPLSLEDAGRSSKGNSCLALFLA